jgi:hypothetical protein
MFECNVIMQAKLLDHGPRQITLHSRVDLLDGKHTAMSPCSFQSLARMRPRKTAVFAYMTLLAALMYFER